MSSTYKRDSIEQTHRDFIGAKVTELWAWVIVDPVTGGEASIGAYDKRGNPVQLIGADREFIESARHIAEAAAKQNKTAVKLVHFPVANVVETLSG